MINPLQVFQSNERKKHAKIIKYTAEIISGKRKVSKILNCMIMKSGERGQMEEPKGFCLIVPKNREIKNKTIKK